MLDMPFRSAKQLAAAIRARKIGCLEVLDLYLARVAAHNPRLNAIVATDVEGARKRARAADAALRRGRPWGPLHGVPMTIKESYDVAGLPTTWGDPALKDNIATTDSLAVQRLKAAGVTLFGKTNVPLMLADWQTHNVVYGTTNNPWDVTRGPGGSSGGSAAALAAGLTGIEAGSDIGASIRNPAHYCGVYGHKPTWGIVSPKGHALPGRVSVSDISAVGPLARGAADLDIALGVMAGPDEIDATGWKLALPAPRKKSLRDFKIAVMITDRNGEVDKPMQDLLQKLTDFLGRSRVKVSDTARPAIDFDQLARVYIALLRSATSGRQSDAAFRAAQEKLRDFAPDDESYYARMLRGNTLAHRDWLAANELRHRMRLAWAAFFEDYDLFLCPPATSTAFPHNHGGERWTRTIPVNGRQQPETDQMFWAGINGVCYLPGTVAPMGLTRDGLPAGVQIVGPQYADRTCIHFARLLEESWGGFVPPPGYA
ncbi:MAG: amidase [Alphaproteobacteria bacterium]|nr:amidase [Alphaproteobacteria bacterium]